MWTCANIFTKTYKLYVAFVDLKKNLLIVNGNALWAVFRKAGVNGKMYRALKGIYTFVSACVRDKWIYTDFFQVPTKSETRLPAESPHVLVFHQ